MVERLWVACDFPCEQADMGDEEPCGDNGGLEIFWEALAFAEVGDEPLE